MANRRKIGAVIVLDGEKKFKLSVSECNKSLGTLKSEMKLVEAETAGNANSLETLRKKHDVLSRTLDEQKHKEEELNKSLKHAQEGRDKVGRQLEEYRERLARAEAALTIMEATGNASAEAMQKQRETVEELSQTVERGEETYRVAESRIKSWEKQLNTAKAQTINATRELNKNAAYMKEAEEATDHCAESIDKFGNVTDDTVDRLTELSTTIKMKLNEALVDLGKNAISSAVSGVTDLKEAENKLAASTGATAEEMERYSGVMEELYKGNYGDSVEGVADAMAMVRQYTGEIDASKLQALTENAMALTDTFDMDLGEAVRGIDSLMKNMGLTAEEAFDYVVTGAQNGLNKSGELTDNIAEYGQLWAQAGFSAEEMFTILQNGLDSGAYNLDKVNDFVKEFGISLSDGRIEESIESFSSGTQNLFLHWQNGEATTRDVFYSVIRDLSEMTDKQEALTLASNTWSALGEDNAMAVLTSLTNVNTAYGDVKGSMESLKEVRYDSITNQYKALGRTLQMDVARPMMEKFLPTAEKGIRLLADNIEAVAPVAKVAGAAIGTIWVTKKAKNLLSDLKDTAKGIEKVILKITGHTVATAADTATTEAGTAATVVNTAATGAATAAQEGLNVAMGACPVLMLVAGLGALAGAVALFSGGLGDAGSEVDELSGKVDDMGEALEQSQEKLAASMDTAAEAVDSAQAKAGMASSAADELARLAEQTSLTNEEQARMRTLAGELNILFPEMGLKIDSVTGKLNMGSEELKNYVENMKKMAEVEAYNRAAEESYDAVVEATTELIEAQEVEQEVSDKLAGKKKSLADIEKAEEERLKALERAQNDYQDALASGAENTDDYVRKMAELENQTYEVDGRTMSYTDAVLTLNDEISGLMATQEEATEAVKEQQDAVDGATQKAEGYIEKANEMNQADAERAQSAAEVAAAYEETAQVSITTSGQELEAFESLSAGTQEKAVEVANAVLGMQESITGTLDSQMQMFENFNEGTKVTKDQILENMQSQVDGVVAWEQNMNTLMTETKTLADGTTVSIDEGLMQYLASMGPEGSTYVKAFVDMSGEELAKANELWSQSVDIKGMKNEWGEELTQSIGELAAGGTAAWNELADEMGMAANDSGEYVVQGMVTGMEAAFAQLEAAGEEAGESLLTSLDTSLGIASPSRKTKETGGYVVEGLTLGMQQRKDAARTMAKGIAQEVTMAISATLNVASMRPHGYNVSLGLAEGIRQGRSRVIAAAEDVAASAVQAAKRKLDIHSPSGVFRKIGGYSVDGAVQGTREGIPRLERAYEDTAQAAMTAYGEQMKEMVSWTDVPRYREEGSAASAFSGHPGGFAGTGPFPGTPPDGAQMAELLQVCLSYLPYLEQMAQTRGRVYLDPREASRTMAPFMNRDLKALRR